MDADVYGPNVPIMLGASNAQPVVEGNKLVPIEAYGVKIMSMAFLQPGDKPMIVRGPILHGLVKQFLSDVKWGELDYLVVDMPPGTGDVQLSLAQLVPVQGAVLVTTPQDVAVADVRRALRMFENGCDSDPGNRREHELLHRARHRQSLRHFWPGWW